MPYCPECGTENDPEDGFCNQCGYPLKESPPGARRRREKEDIYEKQEKEEKYEKREKEEKDEKEEKHEKREVSTVGQLVAGLIVLFIGISLYLTQNNIVRDDQIWPYFIILVGFLVIILTLYGRRTAQERHPRP